MNQPTFHAIAVAAALSCSTTAAAEPTMTQGGFTGLGITPNAHVLGWGRLGLAYDRQLPGAVPSTGDNYVAGFGLLPNLEVSGRVAANNNPDNCFQSACVGIRDLSMAGKAGIGLDAAGRFRVAIGAADIGGAATNFRTAYGVLTFNEGPYELSAGLARRSTDRANRSPLHGPFAGAAWQPLPWVRGQVEYADGNAWAGLRLFAPESWLPQGWSAHVGANARLTDTNLTNRSWFSAGVSIPLYKVPALPGRGQQAPLPVLSGGQQPLPAYEARTLPPAPAASPPASAPGLAAAAPSQPAAAVGDAALQELAGILQQRGFEDISVGRMADGSIAVRVNNASYNWNAVDALGGALAGVAQGLGASRSAYRLVLTQRQLPLVAVTGQSDCLQEWIASGGTRCAAGELSTPGSGNLDLLHAGARWQVLDFQPSWRTVRVAVSPVLRSNVATEVGVFDYSAGLNVGFGLPLWHGAIAEWRVEQELARSEDYAPGGVFSRRRIRNGTERLALTQTVRLPLERWLGDGDALRTRDWGLAAVTGQATLGRVGQRFDGVNGTLRWEPGEGRHRLTAQAGVFRNNDFGAVAGEPRTATPALATYRYNLAPTRTYFEATGGQFMFNDRGVQLGMRQWFSDVAVHVYLKRTEVNAVARTMAGLELSIPLGPRRDMNPRGIQLTGTPRFAHSIETVVGATANVVTSGRAALPPVPSLDALHNSDRASLLYFEDNVPRIRDAAR